MRSDRGETFRLMLGFDYGPLCYLSDEGAEQPMVELWDYLEGTEGSLIGRMANRGGGSWELDFSFAKPGNRGLGFVVRLGGEIVGMAEVRGRARPKEEPPPEPPPKYRVTIEKPLEGFDVEVGQVVCAKCKIEKVG